MIRLLARLVGGGYDTRHQWAWIGCFLGLIALMRSEIHYEETHPGYKSLRHKLRLTLGFLFMAYMSTHDQGESIVNAIIVAAISTVMLHFVLKIQPLRFVWHTLQHFSGMRPIVADEAMRTAMPGSQNGGGG